MLKNDKKYLLGVVPKYGVIPLLSCFMFNCIVYFGVNILTSSWKHYDFTTDFDRAVPLIPEFVSIYLICYIFWVVNYILIARQEKEYCMRFVVAELLSRVICALFFILIPTTNVRPELTQGGFWVWLLGLIYQIDAPTNLFPSIHCLVSWFCYIGIRGQKGIPKWYQVFSCIFAVLVFVSTQVTKQHYFIDIIGGVVVAEGTFYLSMHVNWYRKLERIMDRISSAVFGRKAIYETESE